MSASKDKIKRKQEIEAGTYKRSIAAEKEQKERRSSRIRYIIVAAILVVVFAFIFIYNSALPSRMTTAITIDGEKYSVAQLNYYYSTSYMSFYNNYYYYISYGMFFDTSKSLADQEYTEDYSWRQYFIDAAVDTMTEVQVLNKAADEAGFEMSEEEESAYQQAVESIRTNWSDLGYSSLSQYLNMNYGKGVDMDLVEAELHRTYRASAYAENLRDSYTYSTADLDAYYSEHADELDVISFVYYVVYEGDEIDADAVAAAVNGTSEEEFISYMQENYDVTPSSLSYPGGDLSSLYGEWLLDPARTAGEATVFADEEGGVTYIVMFVDRNSGDYNTVDFRHILIMAEDADGDGIYSEEELAAAEASAEEIYNEWKSGAATEESFAELADQYTEDSGSAGNGGLYEDVYQGEMVGAIDEWLFEDGRRAGDTIVVTNDGSYTGAHVVYYVGQSDMTYAQVQADSTLRSDAFNSWMTEAEEACTVERLHVGMAGTNH